MAGYYAIAPVVTIYQHIFDLIRLGSAHISLRFGKRKLSDSKFLSLRCHDAISCKLSKTDRIIETGIRQGEEVNEIINVEKTSEDGKRENLHKQHNKT